MEKNSKIYVAGHRGLVGSSIIRLLEKEGYSNILTLTSSELDLRNQSDVNTFFENNKPEYVFLCAAKVGGIQANNTKKGEFIYDNIMINTNVIHSSYLNDVKKLLFLGSSCIYPKESKQPIKEEYLLTGLLEPTNEPYAISKITGIKMCDSYRDQYGCDFISAMPTNLYGPNDNYDLENSHVLPALISKIHSAKINDSPSVNIWGDGSPLREFLYSDDLAKGCLFLMKNYSESGHINIGSSTDVSIKELAETICSVVKYEGELEFDTSKPNGTHRKLMDSSKINDLGWKPEISLVDGIGMVYDEYVKSV